MYLTYEDYTNMGGTLDDTTFSEYEFDAECIVNWYTFDRLKNETEYPEQLTRCMYALIKLVKLRADALSLGAQTTTVSDGTTKTTVVTGSTIASQSNDGVSVSYNTLSATDVISQLDVFKHGGEFERIVKTYLQGVTNSLGRKVLYRGLYPDE